MSSSSQDKIADAKAGAPRLVVGIVIDQMRWDYLQRFKNRFGEDGFNRLTREGFSYQNTFIPYSPSVTAAGHATVYTGAYPALHGIVGNDWVERSNEKFMYCTEDDLVIPVGGSIKDGKMSPRNLQATTIGDQLKMATNFKSRVFGVSIKDRGSILPAGRSANAAYWFDDSLGGFISSSWYMNNLPQWVQDFNNQKYPAQILANGWNTLYPISTYTASTRDDAEYERNLGAKKKNTFPYSFSPTVANHYDFRRTPFANTAVLEFSKNLIRQENLGRQTVPDMICISLSATDYIGHLFGPDAVEVEDTYLRLDRDLALFLTNLDSLFGKDYILFLTADHAAPQTPGYLRSKKLSAGAMNAYKFKDNLDNYCSTIFNKKGLVRRYSEFQFYIDQLLVKEAGLDVKQVEDSIINFLLKKEQVLWAFKLRELHRTNLPENVKEMIRRGYHPERSGDIQIILKPHYSDYLLTGADHGSPYNYDIHIPLLWFGKNVPRGETFRKVFMTDIAPTVAAMLRIQRPDAAFGDVLQEIVR